MKIAIVVGGVGIALLCCLVCCGVGAYFLSGSPVGGPSAEEWLAGDWETDREANLSEKNWGGEMVGYRLRFNPDGTYKVAMLLVLDGRWSVSSWDGRSAKVRMTPKVFGLDGDTLTATAVFADRDHMSFDDGSPKGFKLKLRRAAPGTQWPAGPEAKLPFGNNGWPGMPKQGH